MDRTCFKIILASASPRRKGILESLNIDFDIMPANISEHIDPSLPPEKMVIDLAMQKAIAVEKKLYETSYKISENLFILAADTLVFYMGKALGKPATEEEAYTMLNTLSGQAHEVYTGISLISPYLGRGEHNLSLNPINKEAKATTKRAYKSSYAKSIVSFRTLSPEMIEAYIKTGEPMDKAGAYGIQEYGSLLVEKINGCYFNVVGLPIVKFSELLNEFDYKIF